MIGAVSVLNQPLSRLAGLEVELERQLHDTWVAPANRKAQKARLCVGT
jgi:hypothetical protein